MKSDAEKAFVINETAARKFGWIDSAGRANGIYTPVIGKRFHWGLHTDGTADRDGRIVGVMKDFHYASMRNKIEPLVIILNTENQDLFFANIRINSLNKAKTIEYIDKTRQLFKDPYPFKYTFLDEHLGDYYQVEKRIEMLSRTFALLTIIIASLGLLGLSSFLNRDPDQRDWYPENIRCQPCPDCISVCQGIFGLGYTGQYTGGSCSDPDPYEMAPVISVPNRNTSVDIHCRAGPHSCCRPADSQCEGISGSLP